MRDVEEGDLEVGLERLQEELHLLAQLEVERAERLVEEQDPRAVDDRPREGDALALAAGELDRPAVAEAGETHHLERLLHALPPNPFRHPAHAQAVAHVVGDGHVREERVVLEDGVHVAGVGRPLRDVDSAELDAALVGPLEAGDQAKRRRLAGAGRAEQGEELAPAHLEVDAGHGDDLAVGLAEAEQADVRRRHGRLPGRANSLARLRRQATPRGSPGLPWRPRR